MTAASVPTVGAWAQLRTLVRSELVAELRAGEVLTTTLPYAAAGLLVMAVGVGADTPLLRRVGPGVYWALVLLFGSFVALRRTLADDPARRDLLVLLGVDPAVGFAARATASTALLLAFAGLLAPVALVLYDPPVGARPALAGAAVLVAVGLGALATLAADLCSEPAARGGLVPLLVVPLSLPLVIAPVELQQGAAYGSSAVPWLVLVATFALVAIVAGLLGARLLEGVRS